MGRKRQEVTLLGVFSATFLLNTGAAFMWPLVTVYMHNYLHQSLALAGVVLLLTSLMMILGSWLGGKMFDRWSPYWSGIVGSLISLVTIAILIFWHGWPIFGILLPLTGLGDGIAMTVVNSYATLITSRSSRFVFNLIYIAQNVGVVIGTLLVGYLLDDGVWIVFTIAALCYVVLLAIMATDFHVPVKKWSGDSGDAKPAPANLHLIYLICFLIFALWLGYSLWESDISVHMTSLGIPFEKYSWLWTLNGVLIVIGQPITNHIGLHFKLAHQIWVGAFIFALSFVVLIFAKTYAMFVLAMVILTFGEMIGFPGMPAWIDYLAGPNANKGKYQSMNNMALSLGRAVGPLYGGLVIDYASYRPLFISVTVLMLIGLALVMIWTKRLPKKTVPD